MGKTLAEPVLGPRVSEKEAQVSEAAEPSRGQVHHKGHQSLTSPRYPHGQKEDENEGALSPPLPPTACTYHLLSQKRIFWSLWPLMMMWSPHTTSLQ